MRHRALTLLTSVVLLGACGAASTEPPRAASPESANSDEPGSAATHDALPRAVESFRSFRGDAAIGPPERIRIPVIGVSSRLETLGRNPDGTIEVPSDWDVAGWYEGGPKPGQRGPAVILGHVDSRSGPAVFYRLKELVPGDEVLVDHRGGRTTRFVVDRTGTYNKARFPSKAVYFPTLRPVLRLVTCGGTFDATTGHYRKNIIVFASLAT